MQDKGIPRYARLPFRFAIEVGEEEEVLRRCQNRPIIAGGGLPVLILQGQPNPSVQVAAISFLMEAHGE